MKNIMLTFILIALSINVLMAQKESTLPQSLINGYVKTIKGGDFSYHSPFPDVNNSLLIRANSIQDEIVWEMEVVPTDFKEKKPPLS